MVPSERYRHIGGRCPRYLYVAPNTLADGTNDYLGLKFPLTRT